jgi:hypothetical protein
MGGMRIRRKEEEKRIPAVVFMLGTCQRTRFRAWVSVICTFAEDGKRLTADYQSSLFFSSCFKIAIF